MQEYRLRCSGGAPWLFSGEIVSQATTGQPGQRNRWYEITVYQLHGGGYVVSVVYNTQWQGEHDHHWVLDAPKASDVALRLREIGGEILDPVMGFPADSTYAGRQERLESALRIEYADAVSEVLDRDEFAYRIDV